jgi:hypothetical protein
MQELLGGASGSDDGSNSEEGVSMGGEGREVLASLGGAAPVDREAAFFERMRLAKSKRDSAAAAPPAKRLEEMSPEEVAAAEEAAATEERQERRKNRMLRQSITTYGGGNTKRAQLLTRGAGRGRGKRK